MNNLGPQFNNFEDLSNIKKEKMEKEKFELEIAKYHELEAEINSVDGLEINNQNQKISLSFFIEEIKRNNPEDWKEVIDDFKEKIKKTSEEKGSIGASWVLSDSVSKLYLKFLDERIEDAENDEEKKKIELIKRMAKQISDFSEKLKEKNQKTSFGGVSSSYSPGWREYL